MQPARARAQHVAPEAPDDEDHKPVRDDGGEEPLPSFSEQMAQQLGGVRGLVESSIPVLLFVIVNFLGDHFSWWSLRTSLFISVGAALALALYRLARKEPIRHAINGVFGVAIGAFIAYRSGDARDFYLPGILLSFGYAIAMLISVAFRRPLVGWVWAVMADGGSTRWRDMPALTKAFGWLTVLWAIVYAAKTGVQWAFYLAHDTDLLGLARLVLGWPPYILLAAFTVWRVRKITHRGELDGSELDGGDLDGNGGPGLGGGGKPKHAAA